MSPLLLASLILFASTTSTKNLNPLSILTPLTPFKDNVGDAVALSSPPPPTKVTTGN